MTNQIIRKHSRSVSNAKFSVIKYKGEVIKGLTSLLVLQLDSQGLDQVIDVLCELIGVERGDTDGSLFEEAVDKDELSTGKLEEIKEPEPSKEVSDETKEFESEVVEHD